MANVFKSQRREAKGHLEVNHLFLKLQTKENGAFYIASFPTPISNTKIPTTTFEKEKKKAACTYFTYSLSILTRNIVLRCGNMKLVKHKRK